MQKEKEKKVENKSEVTQKAVQHGVLADMTDQSIPVPGST